MYKENIMLKKLKEDEFYDHTTDGTHYDAHIRTYEAQTLGVKVVFCDARGVPVSNSLAPISSYFPNTSFNM